MKLASLNSKTPGMLLLSGGSKVAIARLAKKACRQRGIALHISDTHDQVPTESVADRFVELPPAEDRDWESRLLEYCSGNNIRLILPTRHSDLPHLSQIAPSLEANGTRVSLSSPETLSICIDKLDTASFLNSISIPTPSTFPKSEAASLTLPCFAKPRTGAASIGSGLIQTPEALELVPNDWILQSLALGHEYTTNLYLSRSGGLICAIPHRRIATESGEVVQAKTERIQPLIAACELIAKSLPGAKGILNVQAFYQAETEQFQVVEINPRIGGGYPLCDAAKGHYLEWLLQEYFDEKELHPFDRWTENLLMMRYRDAIFRL